MNFPDAVASALRNYATFAGRARRSEFWFFQLFSMLAQVIAGIIDDAATGGVLVAPEQLDAVYKAFIAVLGLAAVFMPSKKVV